MIFHETGRADGPVVILLHGGGLSDWSWGTVAAGLADAYRVVTPIIDGHGEDAEETFDTIRASAEKLVGWIDENCDGRVRLLAGLSLGAQIAVQTLALHTDAADCCLLESALTVPMKSTARMAGPTYRLCGELIRQKWFSTLQAKSMGLPEDMREAYFRDTSRMSTASLVNMTRSNSDFPLPAGLSGVRAKTLILVGSKELQVMRRSAEMLHEALPGSTLHVAQGMKHGEMSLRHPQEYLALVRGLLAAQENA